MLTQFIHAHILTPNGWLEDGSLLVDDNKIVSITPCNLGIIGADIIDVKGLHLVPGGIELHVDGGGGRDFMEGTREAFEVAVKTHMKHGTTAIFPTLSSSSFPMIEAAAETCTEMMAETDSPIMGLHLEGPFFSLEMRV